MAHSRPGAIRGGCPHAHPSRQLRPRHQSPHHRPAARSPTHHALPQSRPARPRLAPGGGAPQRRQRRGLGRVPHHRRAPLIHQRRGSPAPGARHYRDAAQDVAPPSRYRPHASARRRGSHRRPPTWPRPHRGLRLAGVHRRYRPDGQGNVRPGGRQIRPD